MIREYPIKRRPGLPADLEQEVVDAITPILTKYMSMKKSHMSKDRIIGIAHGAFREAQRIVWATNL